MASLIHTVASGVRWSAVSQYATQGMQLVVTAVMARLLYLSDYGLMGMAAIFTGFAMIVADLGVASAVVQRQEIDPRLLSSMFWANICTGILVAIWYAGSLPLLLRV